jgi:hypothetical protein
MFDNTAAAQPQMSGAPAGQVTNIDDVAMGLGATAQPTMPTTETGMPLFPSNDPMSTGQPAPAASGYAMPAVPAPANMMPPTMPDNTAAFPAANPAPVTDTSFSTPFQPAGSDASAGMQQSSYQFQPDYNTMAQPAPVAPSYDTTASAVAPFDTPAPSAVTDMAPPAATETPELVDIKQQALQQLSPLLNQLDQTPEEKFRTTMMMLQATDDQSLVQSAYAAAQSIPDDKARAQALLDVVNEINYFNQQHQS